MKIYCGKCKTSNALLSETSKDIADKFLFLKIVNLSKQMEFDERNKIMKDNKSVDGSLIETSVVISKTVNNIVICFVTKCMRMTSRNHNACVTLFHLEKC